MSKRTIEVTVESTGGIIIEAVAFKGADCEKATQYLEEALGVAGQRTKKPEFTAGALERLDVFDLCRDGREMTHVSPFG